MEKRLEVDIQVIVHATEDLQKILDSFKQVFDIDVDDFTVKELQGHFENTIFLLQCKLKKKKSKSFVKTIISQIPKTDLSFLKEDLENRCDDSALFLRISKQGLVQRRIALADEDPVKLRIFTPTYSQRDVVKTYSGILEGTV